MDVFPNSPIPPPPTHTGKVSDQGPVWVRSEDKIPSNFISTHEINIWLLEYSLVPSFQNMYNTYMCKMRLKEKWQ